MLVGVERQDDLLVLLCFKRLATHEVERGSFMQQEMRGPEHHRFRLHGVRDGTGLTFMLILSGF